MIVKIWNVCRFVAICLFRFLRSVAQFRNVWKLVNLSLFVVICLFRFFRFVAQFHHFAQNLKSFSDCWNLSFLVFSVSLLNSAVLLKIKPFQFAFFGNFDLIFKELFSAEILFCYILQRCCVGKVASLSTKVSK